MQKEPISRGGYNHAVWEVLLPCWSLQVVSSLCTKASLRPRGAEVVWKRRERVWFGSFNAGGIPSISLTHNGSLAANKVDTAGQHLHILSVARGYGAIHLLLLPGSGVSTGKAIETRKQCTAWGC